MHLLETFDRRESALRKWYAHAISKANSKLEMRLCKIRLERDLKRLCSQYGIKDMTAYLRLRANTRVRGIAGKSFTP